MRMAIFLSSCPRQETYWVIMPVDSRHREGQRDEAAALCSLLGVSDALQSEA